MSYPPGVTSNDPHFDVPSVGDNESGYDESDPLNTAYNDGWNDAIDQTLKTLYAAASEVRKLRQKDRENQ
jgi:hypothetical protein